MGRKNNGEKLEATFLQEKTTHSSLLIMRSISGFSPTASLMIVRKQLGDMIF